MLKWLDIPPVWLAGSLVLAWASRRVWAFDPPGAVVVLGVAIAAVGAALLVWAIAVMQRHRTTPIPHRQPSALVSSGPFGVSRNPIYLGDSLMLAGFSLAVGAPLGLLLLPLFVALITFRFIRAEEGRLAQGFGPAFAEYASRVRRWI